MEHDVLQQQQQQQQEEPMELPPGFRFHPTDEELITYYLARKTADPAGFAARAVGEADLNKCEPWDLPCRARMMGEKEGYFFVVKDRKYPTGTRTNRATESGYWKATGKDREILRGKALVGMKKTLVFYTGRAPRGGKTGWVMHEYRLEGKQHANASYSLPRAATSKDEWVLCRVFKKSLELPAAGNGKKGTSYTGMADVVVGSSTSMADYRVSSGVLPPLIDAAAGSGGTTFAPPTPAHVACFSNALEGQFLNPPFLLPSAPAMTNAPDHLAVDPASPFMASVQMQYAQEVAGGMVHELLQDGGGVWYPKGERERLSGGASQDTGLTSEVNPAEISSSRQHMDHEASFWGY